MKRFTDAIRLAITSKNWLSALSLSLTMPDICGRLEDPKISSGARYISWYRRLVEPKYTACIGPDRQRYIFLSGEDCFALRCSYLHEGADDISTQRIRKALDSFHFITPPQKGNIVHANQVNNKLQLQIDIFAIDIANAVDAWAESVKTDQDIQNRIKNLIVVHNSDNGVRY